ncbi:hypothetical protein ACU686_38550 [Yinghuangia aomiensis]
MDDPCPARRRRRAGPRPHARGPARVAVVDVDDLPYSCVGLVKPGFRRDMRIT